MSKASEWAQVASEVPAFIDDEENVMARVSLKGNLMMNDDESEEDGPYLTPIEALRFARWILDTFGEEPA